MNLYGHAGLKVALGAMPSAVLGFEMCLEDGKGTGIVVDVPRPGLNMMDIGLALIAAWRKARGCEPPPRWRTLFLGERAR